MRTDYQVGTTLNSIRNSEHDAATIRTTFVFKIRPTSSFLIIPLMDVECKLLHPLEPQLWSRQFAREQQAAEEI